MLKVFCDRCKKEITKPVPVTYPYYKVIIKEDSSVFGEDTIDMCEDCQQQLDAFMKDLAF